MLDRWREQTNAKDVLGFARANGIAWYILRPSTPISWPADLLALPAYACEGYRVYRLLP